MLDHMQAKDAGGGWAHVAATAAVLAMLGAVALLAGIVLTFALMVAAMGSDDISLWVQAGPAMAAGGFAMVAICGIVLIVAGLRRRLD